MGLGQAYNDVSLKHCHTNSESALISSLQMKPSNLSTYFSVGS